MKPNGELEPGDEGYEWVWDVPVNQSLYPYFKALEYFNEQMMRVMGVPREFFYEQD